MGTSSEIVGPVEDGGLWQGPTEEEWIERIARPSTPAGETIPWIKRVSSQECSS